MRRISFSLTEPQFLDGTKTVTRRLGWWKLKPGTRLRAVDRQMGLKKGEKPNILGEIEVVSVRKERLDAITAADCAAEGFPDFTPAEFVLFFTRCMKVTPDTIVNRIEFKRISMSMNHINCPLDPGITYTLEAGESLEMGESGTLYESEGEQ